ncbi:MAG: fibronectin type III domain-containing protein, partial [Bacteroidales bacterium]|nr:fibronectin type III domain-containing protein [Bacteroidales bacterium]
MKSNRLSILMLLAALMLPWAMRAQSTNATVPYSTGFETTDDDGWELINGSVTNKWCVGTAVSNTGSQALYVSNDNGTTHSYSITASGCCFAVRTFTFSTASQYYIEFDWKSGGESTYDYLRCFLVPESTTLTAGTTLPSGMTATGTPSGWVDLGGKMNLSAGVWMHTAVVFTIPAAGNYKIVFVWRNDTSGGTQPPAAVDNVVVAEVTCPQPILSISDISATSATVEWSVSGSATEWMYKIDNGSWQSVATPSVTLTGLTPDSNYTITVRSICGASDTSMTGSLTIYTPCEPMSSSDLPYFEGFETTEATTSYSTAGVVPACWSAWSNGTAPGYVPHVVSGTGSYIYRKTGDKSLVLYPGTSTGANGNTKYVMLPPVSEALSNLYLNFWMCTESSTNGYLEVGYVTGADTTGFTAIATFPASTMTVHSGNGLQANNGMDVELSLSAVPDDATRLVFKWFYNGAYGCCIDDVLLDFPPSCPTPAGLTSSNATAHTVDVEWVSSASEFIVEYGRQGFVQGTGDSLTVYGNSVTLDNLQMGAVYGVYVTAVCGSDTSTGSLYGTVTTECSTLTSDDLPYTEDFEAYGTGSAQSINACWSKNAIGTTTNYPYPYSTAAINGSRGLYFYSIKTSSSEYCSWVALPPIDEDLDVNTLMVNFMVKRGTSTSSTSTTTYGCKVLVGVADSVNGFTSAAVLDSIVTWIDTLDYSDQAASSIHSAEVSFAEYTGTGKYIVFYAPAFNVTTSNYNTVYLDDITLRLIPNCFWPSEVALDSIATDAAVISWTPDPRTTNPSYWEVEYGVEGFTLGEGSVEQAYETSITLTGLDVNTGYDVYVRANCGGDISESSLLTIHTNSIPAELPYYTGFETEQDSGWVLINADQTNKWMIGNCADTTHAGDRALFISNNGVSPSYNITSASNVFAFRLIDVVDTGDYALSFDWRAQGESNYDYIRAFIVPNSVEIIPGNLNGISYTATPSGWQNVGTYNGGVKLNLSPSWQTCEAVYHVSEGQTGLYKLVFFWHNDLSGGSEPAGMVDNVNIYKITCPAPTNFVADSVGAYEIDLTWTAHGTETSWQVKMDEGAWISINDNNYAATGLLPVTDYSFSVRAICGEGDTSAVAGPLTVRTTRDCGLNNINIIDTLGNGTSSSYTYTFYGYTSYYQGYNSAIYTVQELNEMGLQTNNRINGIQLHSGTTGGTIRGAKIYVAETSLEGYSSTPSSDTVDRATMTLVYSGDLVVPASSWVEIPFDTPFAYSGNNNLLVTLARDTNTTASVTFYYTSASPDYLNCYGYRSSASTANLSATRSYYRPNIVFDICTEIPNCVRPSNVALLSYSDTTASIQWDNVASNYEVIVSTTSIIPDSVTGLTTIPVSTNSIFLNTLTPNTDYYVYVRSLCGAIGNSEWSIELDFHTACAPQSLPYSEDFENYASGAANGIDPCWVKGTSSTTAYPYPYSTNAVNGQRSLYFYGYQPSSATTTAIYSYAALPMMNAPIDTLMVSFSMRRYSTTTDYYTSRIIVGVMDNPNDITTFVGVDTIDLKNEASLSVHYFDVPLSSYAGNGRYIAFYDAVPPLYGTATYSYSYVYLDDVTVDYLPSCMRVTGVQVSNITATTADVQWTAVDGATSYDIEYGPEGFVHGEGIVQTVTGTTATLTGLMHSTNYDIYVRAHCSATEVGNWSFVTSFATECGLNSLPIMMDFEDEATGTSAELPLCWNKWNNNMTGSYGYYPYNYNSTSNAHSGANSLYWYFSTTTTSYPSDMIFASPAIDTVDYPMNTVEVIFWAKRSTNPMDIIVGVMTDPTNAATFTAVDTIALTTNHIEYTVPLSNYTGYGNYVAFRGVHTGTLAQYIYLDDITIEAISPCERAYNLTATDATPTSAVLAWNDTIGSTQWVVSYATDPAGAWNEVTVTSNPYTLTGLTTNTTYRYRVAPVCVDGQRADWSRETCHFSTSQVPATVPYSYNFEDAAEWANWQTASNTAVNWYRGNVADGNTGYAMFLSADGGVTQGWNLNTVANIVAYRDIDFGSAVHSYQLDFDAYIGGTIEHNYDGIAIVVADPTTPVSNSNTALTSPWGHVNQVSLATVRHDTLWGHHTVYIDGVSGIKRVAFYHFNQATGSGNAYENNPSAIDNIAITLQPCERPGHLTVDTVTTFTAQLSWTGDATANYELCYRVQGAPVSTNSYQAVSGTTAVVTGLTSATDYYWWVRKVCSITATDTLVSPWSASSTFTTACASVSVADTLFENFESYAAVAYNNATDGVLPNCWESWNTSTAASPVYPHVTDSGTYSYCISGRQALTITAGSSTGNYGSDAYVRLRDVVEPTNSLTMAFWMCTESSTNGYLEVGYLMGGDDYELDFFPIKRINASTSTVHSGNGIQDASHGIRDTIRFDSVPAGNYPIVLHWNYTTSFYSVCIDDIAIWSNAPACEEPVIDIAAAVVGETTATISWIGSAASYEVACVPGVWTGLGSGTVVSGLSHTVSGLTENTPYTIAVRAICAEGYYSSWATYSFTTTQHPCFAPTDLTVSDNNYDGATISWTPGESETQWEVNITCTSPYFDQTYTVNGTPQLIVDDLSEGVNYHVAVRSICSNEFYSEWSDAVPLNTLSCDVVTDLTKTSVTATTATITWTATGADKYEVDYGDQGHTDGYGTIVEATTNTITLTNLEPESIYDIYVRQYCTETHYSQWSAMLRITTSSEGIADVESANVTLFPNPASQMVTIDGIEGEATISVVDMNGREVFSTNANETLTIDLTGYAKGAYFVRITGER